MRLHVSFVCGVLVLETDGTKDEVRLLQLHVTCDTFNASGTKSNTIPGDCWMHQALRPSTV
jgi:hypothetical protein